MARVEQLAASSRRQSDMRMASATTTWANWLLSAEVRQRPSKTGLVVTQTGDDHVQGAVRFSGECPGPHESTEDHLSRLDDPLGHLGVQDRPHVSTTVVSTALATGLSIRRPDLPLSRRGVAIAANI